MADWSRLAKIAGMLGSPSDGERLNAARFLQAALTREGLSFGDLSNRLEHGGSAGPPRVVYVDREVQVVRVERPTPNPAAEIAHNIVDRARHKLTYAERKFLESVMRMADWTNGKFELPASEANWLMTLESKYLNVAKRVFYKSRPARPVSDSMLDELGLKGPIGGDMEDHVGAFRSRMAGESSAKKMKPDPHVVDGAPEARYRGDFDLDDLGLDDDPPF